MSNTNNLVAIAIDKNLLKEYVSSDSPRTIYLNNGDEFQIKLFNPETTRIAAWISIDGQYLGNDIILRPGETLWLERYLDKAKKFLFETYEVENGNAAVERAIQHNGEIEVRFYREKPRQKTQFISGIYEFPHYPNGVRGFGTGQPLYNKAVTTNTATSDHSFSISSSSCVANDSVTAANSITGTVLTAYCADLGSPSSAVTDTYTASLDWDQTSTKETGRIAEGNRSNQIFETVNVDVEEWAFRTERIKILPRSQKPFTKNDLNKVFCTECGRKIKPKFKFCPFCGAKQD